MERPSANFSCRFLELLAIYKHLVGFSSEKAGELQPDSGPPLMCPDRSPAVLSRGPIKPPVSHRRGRISDIMMGEFLFVATIIYTVGHSFRNSGCSRARRNDGRPLKI